MHEARVIGLKSMLRRETSPRRVTCCLCGGAICGNAEERVTIEMATGFNPDRAQWWRGKQRRYFHPVCLVAFATGDQDGYLKGRFHRSACMNCWEATTRRPERSGRIYCSRCAPRFGDRALRKLAKTIESLASSDE